MFAGKTEEFIRRIKRATIAHQPVQVFKPDFDLRYGHGIVSHAKTDLEITTGVPPIPISPGDSFYLVNGTEVVAVDEAQFYLIEHLNPLIEWCHKHEVRMIFAGLDMNCYGEPYPTMASLLAMADEVIKLKSICVKCHADANRTFRETPFATGTDVDVGGSEKYEPRCMDCWYPTPRA